MQLTLIRRYATRAELVAFLDGVLWRDEDAGGLRFRREPADDRSYAAYEETFYVDPRGLDGVVELPDEELRADPAELD